MVTSCLWVSPHDVRRRSQGITPLTPTHGLTDILSESQTSDGFQRCHPNVPLEDDTSVSILLAAGVKVAIAAGGEGYLSALVSLTSR